MSLYHQLITKVCAETDPARLAAIENQMRQETGGILSKMSPARFNACAKRAQRLVDAMLKNGFTPADIAL